MAIKKYLSLDRLEKYDDLLKQRINTGNSSTLSAANAYTDEQVANIVYSRDLNDHIDNHNWNVIYDSGFITSDVNSFSNITIENYKSLIVTVKCVNSDGNPVARTGTVIFSATNGITYQFPLWSNLFATSAVTTGGLAQFNIANGWIVCPNAVRSVDAADFLSNTEGGTADNLTGVGSGLMRCTNPISTLTVSSLDQDSNYYFRTGSRVLVLGCKL